MKHIESIQPEYAAEELERIVREEGDATASAALSRLLHNVTGCAIPQAADLPVSEVEELVPLCLSILRHHWQTPLTALGDGTTPMSLADLMRRLIGDRVQGNEALGIPPANADIPAAVAALRERKIGGVPEAPDGVSLPRLLCDSSIANTITELIDDNIGWVMNKAVANAFPNAKKVILGCKTLHASPSSMLPNAEEFDFPYLDHIDTSEAGHPQINLFYGASIKRINMPALERFRCVNASYKGVFYNLTSPCEILMPNCTSFDGQGGSTYPIGLHTVTGLTKMVLGTLTNVCNPFRVTSTPINLIHFEIGQGTSCSVNLQYWTPTNAMAENLDVFLSNFRLYIADRLSDNGSGKTLTLSQEVRDAIHSAGIDTIITNKGWTISPVPTQQ